MTNTSPTHAHDPEFEGAGTANGNENFTVPMKNFLRTRVGFSAGLMSLGCAAALGLKLYTALAQRDDLVSMEVTTRLDATARQLAVESRKRLLPVHVAPYAATPSRPPEAASKNICRRGMDIAFRDETTGLFITAQSHLCLPAADPNISGGLIIVSNGRAEWQTTFRLLGSTNPSAFQTSIPRSRGLLNQLESLILDGHRPGRNEYYSALQAALDADGDDARQQTAVVHLLRLILTCYFNSEEYASEKAFAESHGLIQ